MKCYYWDDVSVRRCSIINEEKYNIGYSVYLARLIQETYFEWGEEMLSEIEKIEKGEKECYDSAAETLEFFIYRDRVDFKCWWGDYEDQSCPIEEFKIALLGWMKFLEMPRDINSYLEVKLNDIEKQKVMKQ